MEVLIWICCSIAFLMLLLFLPIRGSRRYSNAAPTQRFHEADAVLSRRLLNPGSPEYEAYYRDHPGLQESDERARNNPGLLSSDAKYYQDQTFKASAANFQLIDHLAALIDGPGINQKPPLSSGPVKNADFIRNWLINTGAHSVGFTRLKEYHLYSHKGRGPRAGKKIEKEHEFAVALTTEMSAEMLQSAPAGSTVMESSDQYLRSGVLALKLAIYIREMGFDARAHIDGNYELIAPLVAVDAGLGVIGRMGLLMTPRLGPRVRIAVVSTNMPLEPEHPQAAPSTLHFCELCKKCAVNCPVAAIPSGDRKAVNGTERWQINSEKCYSMWTISGTDCGKCMAVCPYSHRDNGFHRFIRWGIKNNLVFRHLAVKLDDVFYGRKPRSRPLPDWVDSRDKA